MVQKMRQSNKDRGEKGILVRLPTDVHAALKADAKKRKRSINAQINLLIERHLEEAA